MRRRGPQSQRVRHLLHVFEVPFQKSVGGGFDPVGNVLAGRPAMRRVVLEATISRRVVGWRDHDAICEPGTAPDVMTQDRVRDHWRRRVFVIVRQHDVDAVGRQHLKRARTGRP